MKRFTLFIGVREGLLKTKRCLEGHLGDQQVEKVRRSRAFQARFCGGTGAMNHMVH